jgi:hypothetical protein
MPRGETANGSFGLWTGEGRPPADEYKPREERVGLFPCSSLPYCRTGSDSERVFRVPHKETGRAANNP